MEVSSVTVQQAASQTRVALSMIKKTAQAEQALVDMIAQAAASGGRGKNLDITV